MRDLLRVADLEAETLVGLIGSAQRARRDPASFAGIGRGRVVAVLFEKPSLRTRFSVEAALARLGAHPIGAYDREVGLGTREPIPDAARVLDGMVDAIVMRTFGHDRIQALADASSVPVINALSDDHHPLQALADLQTMADHRCDGDVRAIGGLRIAFVGDGNNVAHSLIEGVGLLGGTLTIACPPGHEPADPIVGWATGRGATITVTHEAAEAATGADVVYTDVWASMGQESEADERQARFAPYRVTAELLARTNEAIFLHCLPAHRGDEVTAEVIDGPASRVFEQAHNRMHTTTALFGRLWGGP